ncbi:PREDICTED: kunitz-type elastase inhibitor BrEI-like [Ipomoea nil]|uniref:kunitz-type elastase inhibitor BrEI-like n=1 Tax=Ipomoea nil TaxID=35883 RepID=UPI0009010C11|nr:PREDICTED: kunitz-type elastase inhibitor BrEI-like [Ipomoea nil]
MKTLIILCILSVSFLPLSISAFRPHIRLPTQEDYPGNQPVLDVDGDPLIYGNKYYASPNFNHILGVTGGISMDTYLIQGTGQSTCPNAVVLNISVVSRHTFAEPLPIVFYPLGLQEVKESLPLNAAIYLEESDPCANETVWKLVERSGKPVIGTGGKIGDQDDVSNWFRIEKHSDDYNNNGYVFTFWPTLCPHCSSKYWRIGTVDEQGRQLGINDKNPYPFRFLKAK